jgi:hypothetical protein
MSIAQTETAMGFRGGEDSLKLQTATISERAMSTAGKLL